MSGNNLFFKNGKNEDSDSQVNVQATLRVMTRHGTDVLPPPLYDAGLEGEAVGQSFQSELAFWGK